VLARLAVLVAQRERIFIQVAGEPFASIEHVLKLAAPIVNSIGFHAP
jgi:hypothetical protein